MDIIEQQIINNLQNYYMDAYNKRIHLDDIYRENVTINPKQKNSICLWNANNSIININNKCNHLLIYNCNNITIHTNNFISGMTCMKSNNCNLLFKNEMNTNLEISQSFDINIRSNIINSNILYNGINSNFIKHSNYNIINYLNINDGLFSNWNFKTINI